MKTTFSIPDRTIELIRKGVTIPHPFSVEIGPDVDLEGISPEGVVLCAGTRIFGAKTILSAGVRLGDEAPVTLVDCLLGPQVELRGGFFQGAAFLERARMGSGAQVREGSLLEEEASAAHAVGLKQTVLFPFVTLGSLINFCDCLMAGGTSRQNHSEVGSGFIHFNYTPHQDKATPSLMGDVSRGVMLREAPIFLGGQGGLVGPAHIGYGTLIPAGTVFRGDDPAGGRRLGQERRAIRERPFHAGLYGPIERLVHNNIRYIANLLALRQWYIHVRQPFFRQAPLGESLYTGILSLLQAAVDERIARLGAVADKMEASRALCTAHLKGKGQKAALWEQGAFQARWPEIRDSLTAGDEGRIDPATRDRFLEGLRGRMALDGPAYLRVIRGLDAETVRTGTSWLEGIVNSLTGRAMDIFSAGVMDADRP